MTVHRGQELAFQSAESLLVPKRVGAPWGAHAGLARPAEVRGVARIPFTRRVQGFCLHRLQARLGGRLGSSLSFFLVPPLCSCLEKGTRRGRRPAFPQAVPARVFCAARGSSGHSGSFARDVGPLATLFALSCLCARFGRPALEGDLESGPAPPVPGSRPDPTGLRPGKGGAV